MTGSPLPAGQAQLSGGYICVPNGGTCDALDTTVYLWTGTTWTTSH